MGIGAFLVIVGVVLFAGMYFAVYFSFLEKDAQRAESERRDEQDLPEVPRFFEDLAHDTSVSEDVAVRQIENHLRQEVMAASMFVADPRMETLWTGMQS